MIDCFACPDFDHLSATVLTFPTLIEPLLEMYNTAQTTATMAKSSLSLDKGKGKAKEPDQSVDIENPVKPSNKIKKPEKIKLRRIHVSGLPDISEQEAKDRFKSFGEVVGVDGLGKLDATGRPTYHHDYCRTMIGLT